jgi:hypothetical protein
MTGEVSGGHSEYDMATYIEDDEQQRTKLCGRLVLRRRRDHVSKEETGTG